VGQRQNKVDAGGQECRNGAWTGYQLSSCPYPLTVGLERFHTPGGIKHAVLLRYQADAAAPCADLASWFKAYNGRGSMEAGIKQAKTVFQQWANVWLQERIVTVPARLVRVLNQVQRLVRVLANSPASVEQSNGQLLVRFSATSSLAGLVIHLSGAKAVQLLLPLFESPPQASAVERLIAILKCEKPVASQPMGSPLHIS
jgi:hypothetical protein